MAIYLRATSHKKVSAYSKVDVMKYEEKGFDVVVSETQQDFSEQEVFQSFGYSTSCKLAILEFRPF